MIHRMSSLSILRAGLAAFTAAGLALASAAATAQVVTGNINRVGGVSIDTSGLITSAEKSARAALRNELRELLKAPPAELKGLSELRLVSLKQLERAARESGAKLVEELPGDLRFLAGLTRIQYVFVYPEENDIVLAGPGEGWKLSDEGEIIGEKSGLPALRLEDLIVALRTVDAARRGGISCSIDPTEEGRQRLDALLAKRSTYSSTMLDMIRRALGKQMVTVAGVPTDSHLARVLVSSDYHMKRIAMKLEPTPLKELPSFIDMLKRDAVVLDNMMPRWWLEYARQPLGKSADGLAYELPAQRVKCLTEDEVVNEAGKVAGTGTVNPVAQKWADAMTEHYDGLAAEEPAFGELASVMDMCVVAALLVKERLLDKAGCELPTLMAENSPLGMQSYNAPKSVETQTSSIKRGQEYIVTASGGVQIASWQALENIQERPAVDQVRQRARPRDARTAWWNASR
jgi:hypothetical protein